MKLNDFNPINRWTPDEKRGKWSTGEPRLITDGNRHYWNESKRVVAFKCFLLVLGTPIVHAIAATIRVYRLFAEGKDLLRIVAAPFALVGLELAAIYGVFRPYDGRKLYASIERAMYGHSVLAPCFQPDANSHFFGGSIHERNSF